MSLIITTQECFDPEVENCVCGGIPYHDSTLFHNENSCGAAIVKCPECDLCMTEESHNIGYGDTTLKSIYIKVTNRWNEVMSKAKPFK